MTQNARPLSPAQAIALLISISGGVGLSALAAQTSPLGPKALQELQSSLQNGTIKLAGPDSTSAHTRAILQQMQTEFPSTKPELMEVPHQAALNDVQQGKIDLAAVGRKLTDAERQQGLQQYVLPRRKIAIIVSKASPFRGSLTKDQFAQIFRGETTDWSGVDGPAGPIRFIDRPDTSDTRIALSEYPVFQTAPFQSGSNAERLATDSTKDIVDKLGTDGISYAPVDQVEGNPDIRIVPLHDVLPDDERYAFSQPTYYVFKEPCPTAGAQAFLNAAAQSPGSPQLAGLYNVETCAAEVVKPAGSFNWLWGLLALVAGGGLLAWLLKGRGGAVAPAAVPPVVPAAVPASPERPSRMILTARDCRNAYAYWEVPAARFAELRRQGGEQLKLRLYDVTDGPNSNESAVTEQACPGTEHDLHVAIPRDDRDYAAELGYTTAAGRWLSLVRSAKTRIPACTPAPVTPGLTTAGMAAAATGMAAVGAVAAATTVGATAQPKSLEASRMVLVPRTAHDLYAYWEVPEQTLATARSQGGRDLKLRLYDVTGGTPHPSLTQEFDCVDHDPDLHLTVPSGDRTYRAELGYLTADQRWLPVASSTAVNLPGAQPQPTSPVIPAAHALAPVPPGSEAGALMAPSPEMSLVRSPLAQPGGSEIHISAKAAKLAYVHWHLTEADRHDARQREGQQLALRIYDVTGIDLDQQPPHRLLQFNCSETEQNRTIVVPTGDRDYLAELGYLTDAGSWIGIVRSIHAHIPAGQG
jgi:phosphate transport system substrate-binding protein